MNINKFCCFAFILLCLTTSCKKEKNNVEKVSNTEIARFPIEEKFDSYLRNVGFDTRNGIQIGDNIVVEGDVVLDTGSVSKYIKKCELARIDEPFDSENNEFKIEKTQIVVDSVSLVSYSKMSNIKYFIHNSITLTSNYPEWSTAISLGFQRWDDVLNANVSITRVYDAAVADVIIYDLNWTGLPACFHQNLFATNGQAAFPINGNMGHIIGLNMIQCNSWSLDAKISLAAHEIGHALGIRHTDTGGGYTSSGINVCVNPWYGLNRVPLTPINETESIMTPGPPPSTPKPLSTNDIRTIRYLYPANCCPPVITAAQGTIITILTKKRYAVAITLDEANMIYNTLSVELYNATTNALISTGIAVRSDVTSSVFALMVPNAPGPVYVKVRGLNPRKDFISGYSSNYNFTL